MFVFRQKSVHVSKDVFYRENNIVLSCNYQVPNVNPRRIFWLAPMASMKSLMKMCSTIIVSTLGTTTLVANIAMKGVLMKEEPIVVSHSSKFSVLITKSSFINLCDSFDENDCSLPNVIVFVLVKSATSGYFLHRCWFAKGNVYDYAHLFWVEIPWLRGHHNCVCELFSHKIQWWHIIWTSSYSSSIGTFWTIARYKQKVQWSCLVQVADQ